MRRRPEQVGTALQDFGEVHYPDECAEPILTPATAAALIQWLEELFAEDELKAVDLKPRRRALFNGPPGVGKTTLAHHLAARLGVPLLVVQPDRIIDAFLGSTGKNIGALFDVCAGEKVVLFLDEFDALGGARMAAQQGADVERNNSLNTLLQRIERYDGYLIAATNRGETLDQAIWRRFDLQIEIGMPGQSEREKILARYLAPFTVPAEPLAELARAMERAAPSLMRQFCEALKRQLVLGPRLHWNMDKEAVISRLVTSLGPHPDLDQPRLWARGVNDLAVKGLPWPLTRADDEDRK